MSLMTLAEAQEAYYAAQAEYTRIETVISYLTAIKGYLSQASLSFGLAKTQINSCDSAVTAAAIQISSFEQYATILQENKAKIEETDSTISGYIGDVEGAISKADADLETAHNAVAAAYQEWVNASCRETGSYYKV